VPGYNLILPVVRPNGTTILLNRGFITTTRAAAIRAGTETAPGLSPAGEPTEEEVVVEGMLLRQGEKTVWTHENNKEGNEWFWRDVLAMAEWVGGEAKGVQPVLVDAIEGEPSCVWHILILIGGSAPSSLLMQQGIPVGRPAQVDLRNQHASYAMTWYVIGPATRSSADGCRLSLCAATSAMLVFVLRKGKGGPKPRRTI
jgi:surfeit locus 1 family protein